MAKRWKKRKGVEGQKGTEEQEQVDPSELLKRQSFSMFLPKISNSSKKSHNVSDAAG